MGSPYVGEIRMFAGSFPPSGWATCDGQIMAISENDTLFNLIGTTYGGDGQTTFALPNLAAQVPLHVGSNGTSTYVLAQNGGVTSVTLTTNQIPNHTHPIVADNGGATSGDPTNRYFAAPASTSKSSTSPASPSRRGRGARSPCGGSASCTGTSMIRRRRAPSCTGNGWRPAMSGGSGRTAICA